MKTENMQRITTDFDNEPYPPLPRKRIKDHDLRICTWNVRSLNKPGAVSQLETVLEVYKADIIALHTADRQHRLGPLPCRSQGTNSSLRIQQHL